MGSQVNFGAVLRNARERKGYDLAGAARRLRIRPDILRAIESCDFDRMPPRGYTRNMVHAYARLVGLNPTEITRMYLDAAYAQQVNQARSSARPSGFDMGASQRGRQSSSRQRTRETNRVLEDRPPRQNAFGRTLYDDRRTGSSAGRTYAPGQVHSARGVSVPGTQYNNFIAAPKNVGFGFPKLPFIIGGAVLVVLLIVLVVWVFGPKSNPAGEDVPDVPITGLTDTSNQAQGGAAEDIPATKPIIPTSVRVVYELKDGAEPYVVIDNNGEISEKMMSGPVTETVEVSGKWSLSTWMIDAFTITVDGEPVKFQTGSGIPTASVDFNVWLEGWMAEHPEAAQSDEPTDDDTANASSGNNGGAQGSTGSQG